MPAPTSRAARPCCAPGSSSRRARSACSPRSGCATSPSTAGRASRSSRPATRSSRPAIRCAPGAVYDSNAAIIGAAVEELGGEPVHLGVVRDDETALAAALARGLESDVVVFSGGTSKGEGDLSYRVVQRAARPGRRRPRRRAQARQADLPRGDAAASPSSSCPGFPTSAIFTFHEFVAPVIRAFAGLPAERRHTVDRDAADARQLRARTHRVPARRPGAGTRRDRRRTRWARAPAPSRRSAAPTASSRSTSTPRSSMPAAPCRSSCSGSGSNPPTSSSSAATASDSTCWSAS